MSRQYPALNYTDWYTLIKNTDENSPKYITVIDRALQFYEQEHKASEGLYRKGDNLNDVLAKSMEYLYYYNTIHTQLEKLDEHFDRKVKMLKGKLLAQWDKNPPTNFALSKNDKNYLLEDQQSVKDITDLHDMFNTHYRKYSKLCSALDKGQYMLTNITALRKAGLTEEVL